MNDLHIWMSQKPTIAFNPAECGFATMHDADAQRAASGLQTIARSRSAPAATLRSYASNYAAGLLHQARAGGAFGLCSPPHLCWCSCEFTNEHCTLKFSVTIRSPLGRRLDKCG